MKTSIFYRKRYSHGFTLLELLLSLVLVAVLAILLYTVSGRIASKGREAVCTGRLRQLSLAFQQCVSDSRGRFIDDRSWARPLNTYLSKERNFSWHTNADEAARSAMTCPVVNALRPRNSLSGIYGINYVFINAIEGAVAGEPPRDWPMQIQNVPSPSKAWVFTEAGRRTASGSYEIDPLGYIAPGNLSPEPSLGVASMIWAHEGGRKNFAFLDGRVQSMTWSEVRAMNGMSSATQAYREFHGLRIP